MTETDLRDERQLTTQDALGILFNAMSFAIVGASADNRKMTGKIVNTIASRGYQGKVYAINPTRAEVGGYRAYPTVDAVPGGAEAALISLAASAIPAAIEDCGRGGVKVAAVMAGGFAETGARGREMQDAVLGAAVRAGVRLVGPNCAGWASFPPGLVCYATSSFTDGMPLKVGPVSIVTQSGGIGNILYGLLREREVGLARMVSVGNEADLGLADYIEYLAADDATGVVAIYAESVRHPRQVCEAVARASNAGKRVIIVKAGRTASGQRAAESHTAAIANDTRAVADLLRQHGASLVRDIDELVSEIVLARSRRPIGGRRVAVYTVLGGASTLSGDLIDEHDLTLAAFADETVDFLRSTLSPLSAVENPVDPTGQIHIKTEDFAPTLSAVTRDPNVDSCVLFPAVGDLSRALELAAETLEVAAESPVPLAVVWPSSRVIEPAWRMLDGADVPLFFSALEYFRALSSAVTAEENRRALLAPFTRTPLCSDARAAVDAALSGARTAVLSEHASKQVLRAVGIRTTSDECFTSLDDLRVRAADLHYPVVCKAATAGVAHKSDLGLVRLGLRDAGALLAAAEDVIAILTDLGHDGAVIVTEMLAPAPELLIGTNTTPGGDVLVTVALGGTAVELVDDAAIRLAPVSPEVARRMIADLRLKRVLDGWRGLPPVGRTELADVISALSWFAFEWRDKIREIDVNPLISTPNGLVAADALVVTRFGAALSG